MDPHRPRGHRHTSLSALCPHSFFVTELPPDPETKLSWSMAPAPPSMLRGSQATDTPHGQAGLGDAAATKPQAQHPRQQRLPLLTLYICHASTGVPVTVTQGPQGQVAAVI